MQKVPAIISNVPGRLLRLPADELLSVLVCKLQGPQQLPIPKGPKYQAIGYFRFYIFGIVIMVWGRYLIVGHLDP